MNYLRHLVESKGVSHLSRRLLLICKHFGFTPAKSIDALRRIVSITSAYGCRPTAFVTADLLDRHANLIEELSGGNIEVGLHGLYHVDHSRMPLGAQRAQIAEGLRKFRDAGIDVKGFRAPFLRFSQETNAALKENGLLWASQTVVVFPHDHLVGRSDRTTQALALINGFYKCRPSENEPCIPSWGEHCLEIPVSCPDDELLVDRYGLDDADDIARAMVDLLSQSRKRGELVDFLFHPERVHLVAPALKAVLEEATGHKDIWICSLDDVARWWHERSKCTFGIVQTGEDSFRVTVRGNDRASAAVQMPEGAVESITPGEDGGFLLQTSLSPTIRVMPGFCEKGASCLRNEGFVVETTPVSPDLPEPAMTLDGQCTGTHRSVLKMVRRSRGPLLRFRRWPDHYSSAMAISLDVDAVTVFDFVRRVYHFCKCETLR